MPPGGKVLDVGTGPGFVAIEVARLLCGIGCEVVGMDLSSAMLAQAAENAAREGLNGMLTWREGDAKAMPFGDGEFDLIVCNDSLHHWEDPLPVFDEIERVLKDDAKCIVHDSRSACSSGQRGSFLGSSACSSRPTFGCTTGPRSSRPTRPKNRGHYWSAHSYRAGVLSRISWT